MRSRFSIIKDLFFAILAFLSAGIILVVILTAASTYFFPTTVQMVESYYAGDGIASVGDTATSPETVDSGTGQIEIPQPGVEPEAILNEPGTETADGPGQDIAAGNAAPGEEGTQTASGSESSEKVEEESAEVPDDVVAEARPELSRATAEELETVLERGEILPLGDGRVAYRVQSGDTFSQICKKVLGTGNPEIWRQAAREMNIDYRRIQPGSVLIFSPEIIEAAKPYVEAAEGGE